MPFTITGVRPFVWPDEPRVRASLEPYSLTIDTLSAAIRDFTDDTDRDVPRYTEALVGKRDVYSQRDRADEQIERQCAFSDSGRASCSHNK